MAEFKLERSASLDREKKSGKAECENRLKDICKKCFNKIKEKKRERKRFK